MDALTSRLLVVRCAVSVQLRRRPVWAGACVLVACLTVAGVLLVLSGSKGRTVPPTPPAPVAAKPVTEVPTGQLVPSSKPTPSAAPAAAVCRATVTAPTEIAIPAIGVHSCLLQLGLNPDKTVQTPSLEQVGVAGWYKYSPVPGAIGPAVILGHIDSAQYGPGVFFRLGTLRAGDIITVDRADQLVATFKVSQVAEYPKTNFPSQLVYGNTSTAVLRLVTCGGRFDSSTGSYLDNIVVYADLVSLTHE